MRFTNRLLTPLCAIALFMGTLLTSSGNFAQAQTATPVATPPGGRQQAQAIVDQLIKSGRIIRSSEVHRGMRGYARSVFQGTKIEQFPVVVLGVLQKVEGGGDVVLIKVLGGTVVQRNSGIIAGMSGSPVYINGKLLGAIALGWPFPKEPIGGVTPITEMIGTALPENNPIPASIAAIDPAKSKAANVYLPKTALEINGKKISRVVVAKDATRLAMNDAVQNAGTESGTVVMRPTSTLLQVSGFSQEALPKLKQIFEPYGLEPFIAPSSKKLGVPSPKLEPGSAVGVQLVSGDMNQTAVGTITFRWGNRIVAFGHPMFGQGTASLPMATAYVNEIFPSYSTSFKLASPIAVVGAIQQDTQFAIGGTVNAVANTIPMRITLHDPNRQINKTFHVQVMNDPVLTPQLVSTVAQEAVQSTLGLATDKMVQVAMRMDVAGADPIVRHNLLYSSGVVSTAALADLTQSISLVQSNPFAKGNIQDISLDVTIQPGRNVAVIKSVTANRNKIKAGESLQVNVVLQPVAYPAQRITRTFTFKVPEDAPAGIMRIAIASSANYWPMQVIVGGPAPDPINLPELISAWNNVGSLNELMLIASTPQHFLRVDEQNVQNPPPVWARLMGSAPSTAVESYNQVDIQRATVDYAIDGAKLMRIPVESAQKTSTAADTSDDDGTATPDVAAPDASGLANDTTGDDNGGDGGNGQSSSGKSAFALPGANWNSTFNWNNTSWNQKIEAADAPQISPTKTVETKTTTTVADAAKKAATTTTVTTTTTTTPPPPPPTIGNSKTLGRPALNWVDMGTADFLKGEFSGAVVDSNGIVRLAPLVKQLATTALPFIWSIAGDNQHNVYLGSGGDNNAEIYHIDASGKQDLFFKAPGIAISAMTTDDAGNVYAAVSPGGKIYRITPDGNSQIVIDTQQSFVWALTWDANQQLLIGTGGEHGTLFRVNPAAIKGTFIPKPLRVFTEGHIRTIDVAPDGTIYAGTGAPGILYSVNPQSGAAKALYEVDATGNNLNSEVLAVAATAKGVYFGTSLNGTLYRWTPDGGGTIVYPSPQKVVYALLKNPNGDLYMATGENGVVYQLTPSRDGSGVRAARILEPTQLQSLSLYLTRGDHPHLLVGTGNNGAAFEISLADSSNGTYTSRVYDTGKEAQWGTLRAIAQNSNIQTRSGNTSSPDNTWSNWSTVKTLSGDEMQVTSPPSRFLQYKVLLNGSSTAPAAFARVAISYQTQNQAPQLALSAPVGGEYWSGKKSITWTAADPDSDTLSYTLSLLGADQQWKSVSDDIIKDSPFELDTTKWSDGSYRLKATASDILSNPIDPQSTEVESLPFIIDNTPPVISNSRVETEAGQRFIKADLSDAISPIVGAEWRYVYDTPQKTPDKTDDKIKLDKKAKADEKTVVTTAATTTAVSGDDDDTVTATTTTTAADTTIDPDGWHAMAAQDGIFDSLRESAVGILTAPEAGKGKPLQIELRGHDAAGNEVSFKIDIPH